MPIWLVEEQRWVTFTHRIEAKDWRGAIEKIKAGHKALELPDEDSGVDWDAIKEVGKSHDGKRPE
jgi:hypothetical protein